MSLFEAFKTNRDKENSGIWLEDFPSNKDGTTPGFLIARASKTNTNYSKAAQKVGKKFQKEMELGILSEDRADPAVKALFLDTVLLGWRNVFDADEKPLPYTRENAAKLIEVLPDLYEFLYAESRSMSNFRDEEIKVDAGN
jgi:hypothetical protein